MKKKATRSLLRPPLLPVALLSATVLLSGCGITSVDVQSVTKEKGKVRKKTTVKIYPDVIKRIIHVKSVEETPLDFFVFDLNGNMIRYFKMQEGDHEIISGLERGDYMYQVFQQDVMNDSGKIIFK